MRRVKRDSLPYARAVQKPSHPKPVRRGTLMQRTRRSFAVEVHQVTLGNHPEFREVEMRVQTLKRIKRPGYFVESFLKRALALRKLQIKARLEVSIFGLYREHMRMQRRASFFKSRKRIGEPDQPFAFKRS